MKKIKILLVLFALAGALGANAFQKTEPQYYVDLATGEVKEIMSEEGFCDTTEEDVYCKYEHIPTRPLDNDLSNYTPVTPNLNEVWIP